MQIKPVERLILLKLVQLLELIDRANARDHDADAQAIELGTPEGMGRLFELIDLEPHVPQRRRVRLSLVSSTD